MIIQAPFGQILCRGTEPALTQGNVLVLVRPESLRLSSLAPASRKEYLERRAQGKNISGRFQRLRDFVRRVFFARQSRSVR